MAPTKAVNEAIIAPAPKIEAKDRIPVGDPRYCEIVQFLDDETALLNGNDLLSWLELLEEDLVYRAPVRVTPPRGGGSGLSEGMYHFDENYKTLQMKASRLATNESAWAEVPSSRSRRFITGIRCFTTGTENEYVVWSNELLVRSRYSVPEVETVSCEREDLLRRGPQGLRVSRRYIYIDHATVPMQNFAVFF